MDIFLQKEASNSFFAANKQTKKDDAEEDGDELKNDVSKIICSGNVVYHRQAEGQEQVGNDSLALANKGDYEEKTGIIMMTGAIRIRQANSPRPCTTISCAWSARTWSRNTRS